MDLSYGPFLQEFNQGDLEPDVVAKVKEEEFHIL